MTVTIKQCNSDPTAWNLYVNGKIAVVGESMQVCDNIKEALERPMTGRFYSEAAEIAEVIRATR